MNLGIHRGGTVMALILFLLGEVDEKVLRFQIKKTLKSLIFGLRFMAFTYGFFSLENERDENRKCSFSRFPLENQFFFTKNEKIGPYLP